MLLNGDRSCCERRKEARSSRRQEDFDHVLGNQNRPRVSSFIRQQTRGGRGKEQDLRRFWRENVEESCCLSFDYYGIKTKVSHLYPNYVIFSSSKRKNLGTFCFESQCFVDWKPRKERTLPSSRCFAYCKE